MTKKHTGYCSLLVLLLIFIGSVSIYDVYWTFKTQQVIAETEQNPIGQFLIEIDGGDIALFMTLKMLGTMIVLSTLVGLYQYRHKWGITAAIGVAIFQFGLMLYLNFGECWSFRFW